MSHCKFCNSELPPRTVKGGRERLYCCSRCRMTAFRRKRRAAKAGSAFVTGTTGAVAKQADTTGTFLHAEPIMPAGTTIVVFINPEL